MSGAPGMLQQLGSLPEHFVDSFCDPESVSRHFSGQLGRFTPCFTDIVVLGVAHLNAIVLASTRIYQLRSGALHPTYRLKGLSRCPVLADRALQTSAVVATSACFLIVLGQLNARIASDPDAFVQGSVAPFEWAGYVASMVSWVTITAGLVLELGQYTPQRSWLLRFSLCFIFTGQLAKLRFVVILSQHRNYFFWLSVANTGLQGWLALLAVLHHPRRSGLEPNDDSGYVALDGLAEEEADKGCPEATSGLWSLITFSWISPLLRTGYKHPLQFEDVWDLPPDDRIPKLHDAFQEHWDAQLPRGQPSLIYTLWRMNRRLFLTALPFKLCNDAATFVGPTFLSLLLGLVATGGSATRGYSLACLMLLGLLAGTLADNQHFQRVMRAGFHTRAVLVHQVFLKVLSLSPAEWAHFSTGRVFNLVTSDVETLQLLSQSIMNLISSPLRIIVAMVLLYLQLGVASLVALGSLILMMPVQAVLVRLSSRLLRRTLGHTDERAKAESELLGAMDVVKCATWEASFWDHIQGIRNTELGVLWKSFLVAAVNSFLLNFLPTFVSVATFFGYVLLGHNLTAAEAFTSLALFNVLRLPLFMLPQLISQLVNAQVAIQRLEEFLVAEEQEALPEKPAAGPGENAISVKGSFAWQEDQEASLTDITLDVPAGSLVAIVGSTGSGKTSLLSAALGLMQQLDGPEVDLRGKVAYVPQTAFIFNETVRNNILFGQDWDADKYQRVIEAANIGPDLALLQGGDQTELGDRGVNVSGGQKQRISIARAMYSEADTFLLDDPLSALDSKVGRAVFNKAIMGAMRGKTRVLATNQLQYARSADIAILMLDGEISEIGPPDKLLKQGGSFANLLSQAETDEKEKEEERENDDLVDGEEDGSSQDGPSAKKQPEEKKEQGGSGRLTEKEGRASGRVSFDVVAVYIRAMGGWASFLLLAFGLIATEASRVGGTVWLSYWTESTDSSGHAPHGAFWYLGVYAGISGIQVLCMLLVTFLFKAFSIKAARGLHNSMLARLLRAPMSYFHTTPSGRIINRLTKDTADVDKNLADFSAFYIRSFLQLLSTIAVIGFTVPFALPAIVPILLMFYFLYQYFQASVREVKRLDSISRSPVYSSIGEALTGLATIRAFRAEERLAVHNAGLVDDSAVMSLVNMSLNRWLSVRLETLGALAAFAAAVLAVEQRGNASTFGLVLSYALQLTMLTSMTVRLASVAENSFNAVERIDEIAHIDQEDRDDIPGSRPDNWPSSGKVEFRDVKMRYRENLPLVLHGLSVTLPAGSRCGVVGRTGAGKSSLVNCLFRLQELSSGSIVIDGVDITGMGLKQLRSGMSIIPQVPVLFTGSMRSNLDPFSRHSDDECWEALERSHLSKMVQDSGQGLEMELAAGGAPLSAGQKQLAALARALLQHSKILVLDEATANVDVETDALIQMTVREEFADCTLIAIAHRIHTIIDADLVLVMDAGTAAEHGTATELLANPDGVFSGMVNETGASSAKFLREAANRKGPDEEARARAERGRAKNAALAASNDVQQLSSELVSKADSAKSAVSAALAFLQEHTNGEQLRRELDIQLPGTPQHKDQDALRQAMQQAMAMVEAVGEMAAKCQGNGKAPSRRSLDRPPSRRSLDRRVSFMGQNGSENGVQDGMQTPRRSFMGSRPPSRRNSISQQPVPKSPGLSPRLSGGSNGSHGGFPAARSLQHTTSMPLNMPVEEAADAARELVLPISTPAGLAGPKMPVRSSDKTSAVLAATSSARKQFARQRRSRSLMPQQAEQILARLAREDPTLSQDPTLH